MKTLYALRIINFFSLFFGVVNFFIAGFGFKGDIGIVFAAACVLTFFLSMFKVNGGRLLKSLNNLGYYSFLDEFRKGLYISAGLFIVALVSFNYRIFEKSSALYVLIYLVSSVVLLRTLRYIEHNRDNSAINKINFIYSMGMIILTFVLSLSYIRQAILRGVIYAGNLIAQGLFYIFWWIIYAIGSILFILINYLKSLALRHARPDEQQQIVNQGQQSIELVQKNYKPLLESLLNNHFLLAIFKVFVFCLVIYIIYRVLNKNKISIDPNEEYIEDKEFIFREGKSKGTIVKRAANYLRPKNQAEYVRFYYIKFMKLCIRRNIKLEKSDTTQDINTKAGSVFQRKELDAVRNFYIKVRYGNHQPDKNGVREFISHYKNLKNVE